MKKFLAMLCAAVCLGFAFTACSNDSSSDSGEGYILETGTIPQNIVDSAQEWRQNIGQYASYADKKELRDYLYEHRTAYNKTTVSETQLRQMLSEITPSASAIDEQIKELKRTTNDVLIIETIWFYAEQQ
ncbi:hypothetical protein MSI_03150 [Treponema sp. JC4]|uniref:hypothetical protein n=1 Tax=Treponema sp. JC4 TaxID=1124982 RepID=UPI00025B0481|nr:hypothetical protein [Treponema sp. JC4]EID85887.1 hypothetical protein MSI_03150 [Treponema sp. JC4]